MNGPLIEQGEGQMRNVILVILVFLVGCGIAAAQTQKNEDLIDDVQPQNFRLESGVFEYCYDGPPVNIPVQSTLGVTTSIDIPCDNPTIIEDLNVLIQISHTWVGDLSVKLSKQGGPEALLIIDRPGLQPPDPPPGSCCGCSGNNIDAILNDEAADPVEDECAPTVPTIQGELIPGDPPGPLLAQLEGLELCGTWELNAADHAGQDSGFLSNWCLLSGPPDDAVCGDGIVEPFEDCDDGNNVDGDGCDSDCMLEEPVPAASNLALLVLVLLLLTITAAVLLWRRREEA
jgi:cysteine-rich repeat protein